MKILFFISIRKHGTGGHIYSLNHISKELGKIHEVKIITIGCKKSSILVTNPHYLTHYEFNGKNIIGLINYIKRTKKQFRPDIYHFFDYSSYNVLRLFIGSQKHKIVVNKCGGPNYPWPFVNNFILFSKENYDWYLSDKKFKNSKISLIPNRVQKIKIDQKSDIAKDADSFNFLRICRIGTKYRRTIQDSINLILYLHKKGYRFTRLIIIGTIEDQNVYKDLRVKAVESHGLITFFTDDQYTKEASNMLYLADACIGTGRGFMEAASLGIPLLSFNANDEYPVLITDENFADVFKANFSERNQLSSFSPKENLSNIERMIHDKEYYNELSKFSSACFDQYFNINKVLKEYTSVYENAITGPNKYFSDIRSIIGSFRSFYTAYKTEKKTD